LASNPTPVPLLVRLGITPEQKQDIKVLRDYLFLLDREVSETKVITEIIETSVNNLDLSTTVAFVQFSPKTKTADYTALDFDFIEAENGATIKLPQYPDDGSEVIIANGDGTKITVDGNGRKIKRKNSTDTLSTTSKGTTLHFQYFVDRGYWRTR
jgi:hypothetical protein